jgi:hypothetical protein
VALWLVLGHLRCRGTGWGNGRMVMPFLLVDGVSCCGELHEERADKSRAIGPTKMRYVGGDVLRKERV